MSNRIGFVILSHNNPRQLLRLVLCLQRIYDNPPIAIHHDIGQSQIRRDDFPSDAQFVSPHLKTGWGKFSVVGAALRALELLYQNAEPDWFVLLSAADYPTMPAGRVLERLSSSGMDAFLDYREVPSLSVDYKLSFSVYFINFGTLPSRQTLSRARKSGTKTLRITQQSGIGLAALHRFSRLVTDYPIWTATWTIYVKSAVRGLASTVRARL